MTSRRPLSTSIPIALRLCALLVLLPVAAAQDAAKPEKPEGPIDVAASIDRGVRWLIGAQSVDGTWNNGNQRAEVAGSTALATYTLLKCGVEPEHPAVRKGLAYVEAHVKDRVYETSLQLMVYAALPEAMRPADRVKERSRFLLKCFNETAFGYPGNHGGSDFDAWEDLSNTQYALLGLAAAEKCGQEVPSKVWRAAAEYVMSIQKEYGSFGYRPGADASLSMTVAGTASLELCRKELADERGTKILLREIQGRLSRAEDWFQKNWYLEENRRYGKETEDDKRWTYYYLYGLERVGSFLAVDLYAGRDWYGEGSRLIVGRQAKDGHWGTIYGENDINTSFALLFLSRGSNTTDVGRERIRAEEKVVVEDPLEIRTDGKNPATFWLQRSLGRALEIQKEGARLHAVTYESGGRVLGTVTPETPRHLLTHRFEANGDHAVRAKVTFVDAEGAVLETLASNEVVVAVDNVLTDADRSVIADAGRNLLLQTETTVTASSQEPNYGPERAVDSNGTTDWLCRAGDASPSLEVRLGRALSASCIKLTPATGGAKSHRYDRPKEIEVVVNGGRKQRMTLPDLVDGRHVIEISRGRVQRFRIRVLSVYPGTDTRRILGFEEVELFKTP
ncbi:MAG: prenyltransferase/squalene oxidase repeat-containing protein [Planctomycetota bacterium]